MKIIHPRTSRAGMTLLEASVSSALLFLVLGTLAHALTGVRDVTNSEGVKAQLQSSGERALEMIISDLRASGFSTVGGIDYPVLFENGAAPNGLAEHVHSPAPKEARPSDSDFGPNREIVFRLPADADGDGRPDVTVDGQVIWDAREFSYVVINDPDGVNRLERRIDGVAAQRVASWVERIVFDDAASSGFVVPLNSIRVRIDFRRPDDNGLQMRHSVEASVRTRNG